MRRPRTRRRARTRSDQAGRKAALGRAARPVACRGLPPRGPNPRRRRCRMNFFDVLAQRRSVRRFETRPVEPEKLQAIFDAAAAAPSAGGLQAYEIVVLADLDAGQRLALDEAACGQELLESVPVVMIFCSDGERSRERY